MRTNGNGTRHPDEILAEIERTRSEMDRTLGTIEQRLTPGQLLDQGMQYLKDSGAADYARNLRGSVSTNPLPVALVGIGLAWLMAADRMDRRSGASTSSGPSRMGEMKESLHGSMERMKESAGSMHERASGVMSAGRQKLDDTARMARERADQLRSSYDRIVNEQPLSLGAIGLAIGAVMAAALPRTRKEEELLSGAREAIADKASELAKQASEKGRETLEKGRQHLDEAKKPSQPQPRTSPAQEERAQFKAGVNGGPNPPIAPAPRS
ncbi:MAG TPA: DUF3618 domain-containing protein [Burkholderiales bacterium]|nr:DUF3618 domain-containing protein [Burkholderiales bacterium]